MTDGLLRPKVICLRRKTVAERRWKQSCPIFFKLYTKNHQTWAKSDSTSLMLMLMLRFGMTPWPFRVRQTQMCFLCFSLCRVAALQVTECRWMHPVGDSMGRWRPGWPARSESPAALPSLRLRHMQAAVTVSKVSSDLYRSYNQSGDGVKQTTISCWSETR